MSLIIHHQTRGPDSMQLELPVGVRFLPSDCVLVNYLKPKLLNRALPLVPDILEIDIYSSNPTELAADNQVLKDKTLWYILTPRDRKYPNGSRPNRAAKGGYWKASGADIDIRDDGGNVIGYKKTLVFYEGVGKAPNGKKTDWIMHEYRAKQDVVNDAKQFDDLVLCRIRNKLDDKTIKTHGSLDETEHLRADHIPNNNTPSAPPVAPEALLVPRESLHSNGNGNGQCQPAPEASTAIPSDSDDMDFWRDVLHQSSEQLGCRPDQTASSSPLMADQIQLAPILPALAPWAEAAGSAIPYPSPAPLPSNHDLGSIDTDINREQLSNQYGQLGSQVTSMEFMDNQIQPEHENNSLSSLKSSDFSWNEMAKATRGGYGVQMGAADTNFVSTQEKEAYWSGQINNNSGYGGQIQPAACATNLMPIQEDQTRWSSAANNWGYGAQTLPAINSSMPTRVEGSHWSRGTSGGPGVQMRSAHVDQSGRH